MGTNVIHSLFVCADVPLIARKRCCLRVSSTLRICVHCRTPFYIAPPFPVTPTFTSVNLATACLSFSSSVEHSLICLIWPISHRYWLCRVPVTGLRSHCPHKIVDLLRLHDAWLLVLGFLAQISVSAVCVPWPVTSSSQCCLCMHHEALL